MLKQLMSWKLTPGPLVMDRLCDTLLINARNGFGMSGYVCVTTCITCHHIRFYFISSKKEIIAPIFSCCVYFCKIWAVRQKYVGGGIS